MRSAIQSNVAARMMRAIEVVSKSYAHVVVHVIGYRDGEGDTEKEVNDSDGIEIAISQEECAGGDSPDQSDSDEKRVWNVREGKHQCGEKDRGGAFGKHPEQSGENEGLQNKLLERCPDKVSPCVRSEDRVPVRIMERVHASGDVDSEEREAHGSDDDPSRRKEST